MGANSKGLAGFAMPHGAVPGAPWQWWCVAIPERISRHTHGRSMGRCLAVISDGHATRFTYHAWKHLSRARCCLNARKQGYMSHPWPRMHQATAVQAHINAWFAYLGHNCGYRTPHVTHTRYRWANVNTLYRVLMPCDADSGASSHTWPLHSPR